MMNDATDVTMLLADLNSRNDGTRQKAIQEAKNLPPDVLLRLLEMGAVYNHWSDSGIVLLLQSLFYISIPRFLLAKLIPHNYTRESFVAIFADAENPRLLGGVLNLLKPPLGHKDPLENAPFSLIKALERLLQRTDTASYDLLTPPQRKILFAILNVPYVYPPMTVALVKMLHRVGDVSALSLVEPLSGYKAYTPQHRRLREAAQDCVAYLTELLQQQKLTQTLLRASDASHVAASDVLLRPAASAEKTPAEQLLRATRRDEM